MEYNLLKNGVFLGVRTHLLSIDPNFLDIQVVNLEHDGSPRIRSTPPDRIGFFGEPNPIRKEARNVEIIPFLGTYLDSQGMFNFSRLTILFADDWNTCYTTTPQTTSTCLSGQYCNDLKCFIATRFCEVTPWYIHCERVKSEYHLFEGKRQWRYRFQQYDSTRTQGHILW